VVLSTSPGPGSAKAGRTDKGWLERETRTLEIDARRCKPHQVEGLENSSHWRKARKIEEASASDDQDRKQLRRRKIRSSKGASRKSREVEGAQVLETDEDTGATLWNRKTERRR